MRSLTLLPFTDMSCVGDLRNHHYRSLGRDHMCHPMKMAISSITKLFCMPQAKKIITIFLSYHIYIHDIERNEVRKLNLITLLLV